MPSLRNIHKFINPGGHMFSFRIVEKIAKKGLLINQGDSETLREIFEALDSRIQQNRNTVDNLKKKYISALAKLFYNFSLCHNYSHAESCRKVLENIHILNSISEENRRIDVIGKVYDLFHKYHRVINETATRILQRSGEALEPTADAEPTTEAPQRNLVEGANDPGELYINTGNDPLASGGKRRTRRQRTRKQRTRKQRKTRKH